MKEIIVTPDGWMCKLSDCPPGFFMYEGNLCFKTKYRNLDGNEQVYFDSGETFCVPNNPMVQPVNYETREIET